jgi:hypothetical protein
LAAKTIVLKNLHSGEQKNVSSEELLSFFTKLTPAVASKI